MSHEVETMAYAGEVPWHGLGKRVLPDLTTDQMLVEAGLDWKVRQLPLTCRVGNQVVKTDKSALVRDTDNAVLSVVGNDWKPVQNHTAFEFFHDFVMAGDMEMHTAGSLKSGQMVWALAKVSESFEVFGGDKVDSYLLFSNPHQYGKTVSVRFTPIRVVCNNTLSVALTKGGEQSVNVHHRHEFDSEKVKETLGLASAQLANYKEFAEFLGSKRYTEETVFGYFQEVFPNNGADVQVSRVAQKALEVLDSQPGHEFAEGSWWQAYNAVTFMTDHVTGRSNDTRMASAWYGVNQKRKVKALEKAIEYANVS